VTANGAPEVFGPYLVHEQLGVGGWRRCTSPSPVQAAPAVRAQTPARARGGRTRRSWSCSCRRASSTPAFTIPTSSRRSSSARRRAYFIAMELVAGPTLASCCASARARRPHPVARRVARPRRRVRGARLRSYARRRARRAAPHRASRRRSDQHHHREYRRREADRLRRREGAAPPSRPRPASSRASCRICPPSTSRPASSMRARPVVAGCGRTAAQCRRLFDGANELDVLKQIQRAAARAAVAHEPARG